jgi:hypothetical protein
MHECKSGYIHTCPFMKTNTGDDWYYPSKVCKYYEPMEEEKYALFASEKVKNLYTGVSNVNTINSILHAQPVDTISIQLTDLMTYDELTTKIGALWMNGETSWLKNVEIRKVSRVTTLD